jgi:hypothetical protein
VCWSAIIVFRCGCFREASCVATSSVGCVVCCYLMFVSGNALLSGLSSTDISLDRSLITPLV